MPTHTKWFHEHDLDDGLEKWVKSFTNRGNKVLSLTQEQEDTGSSMSLYSRYLYRIIVEKDKS